jgi:molybdopterin molybdotransferase
MISVEDAKKLILETTNLLSKKELPLQESGGYFLAEDLHAPLDLPSFEQSAMDGFAIIYEDYQKSKSFKIVGEIPAGVLVIPTIHSGEAYRIFTGAPVPKGATAVVMQEKTQINGEELVILDDDLEYYRNIRKSGAQIQKGKLALKAGFELTPATLGFLASMGFQEVKVYNKPSVSILVTGNELIKPGNPLQLGQVYESNSYTLIAVLKNLGISNIHVIHLPDELEETIQKITEAIGQSDLVLATGGISVGKYDFVGMAMEKVGVEQLFYKVAQRPGKPLFYGKYGKKPVFALPGNPASVLTCFYNYVYPCIKKMQNAQQSHLKTVKLTLSKDVSKPKPLTNFLKARINGTSVEPLTGQESFIINSFAFADAMIQLPAGVEEVIQGEMVEVLLLP